MKQPSVYLKMRVLGAVDTVEGRTRDERIKNVSLMTFLDEEANPRQFTWRTIQTWFYRYKNHGITGMTNQTRKDKGQARKVTPEELLEAINAAKPHFHDKRMNKMALYRFSVEKGLLSETPLPRERSNASSDACAISSSSASSTSRHFRRSTANSQTGSKVSTTAPGGHRANDFPILNPSSDADKKT